MAERPRLDPESEGWIRSLTAIGREREQAVARLHGLLLRVARREIGRRAGRVAIAGPELDETVH